MDPPPTGTEEQPPGSQAADSQMPSGQLPASQQMMSQQAPSRPPPEPPVVRVRRPRAIVFDILGTASKSGFLERVLFPYLKTNLETYVTNNWSKRDFIRLFAKIQSQSMQFNKQDPTIPIVASHESHDSRASLLRFIDYVTENGIDAPAVTQLRFKVWFQGYDTNKIRTPIYKDVPNKLKVWFTEGIKFYVFSNTWIEAQKALLRNTTHGDLTNLISGHFDNDFGSLLEPDSWRRLCVQIHEQPGDILFLTKSITEARVAVEAGVPVVLVLTHRHNVKAVSREERQRFPYVRTLFDLVWTDTTETSIRGPDVSTSYSVTPTALTGSTGIQRSPGSSQTGRRSHSVHGSSNATSLGRTSTGGSSQRHHSSSHPSSSGTKN